MQQCCTQITPGPLAVASKLQKPMKGNMKRAIFSVAISALLSTVFSSAIAHEAHVHGVGKLDVAIDGAEVTLHLNTPLMNLLGFEHAAKNPKDRAAAQKMAFRLRDAGRIFVTTPAAGCRAISVKLASNAINPILLGEPTTPPAAPEASAHGHADLDADFILQCSHPDLLESIDVSLFEKFKGFQKIDVQMVTQKKQLAVTLRPSAYRISWE